MTKERVFKKEYGTELLEVAKEDILDAQKLFESNAIRKENIFFLCQQSIEKALKSGLIKLGISVPLVHDLSLLIDRYPKEKTPPVPDEIKELTEFATIRRYEESIAQYTDEEINACIQLAKNLHKWVEKV